MTPIQQTIITMLIIVAAGFICGKIKLIPPEFNKKLSDVLMFLINPVILFVSYQKAYSPDIAKNLMIAAGVAAAMHVLMIIIVSLVIPKKGKNFAVERVASVFGNCSFFGIPMVQGVFGTDGIIYLAMFVAVFNILAWTWGVSQMSGKASFTDTLKHLCTPIVIAVVLGVIFFFTRISLPEWLMEPLRQIGNANTPVAMLVAGATLSGTKFLKLIKKVKILLPTFLRLVFFPAMFAVLTALAVVYGKLPSDVMQISLIAVSCPTAVITITFAHHHGKDSVYASEIFAISTVLCAVTIPLVIKFYEFLIGVI